MCLDLYVHWVSRSMHLTELKQSDWVISAWIINEFENVIYTPLWREAYLSVLLYKCLALQLNKITPASVPARSSAPYRQAHYVCHSPSVPSPSLWLWSQQCTAPKQTELTVYAKNAKFHLNSKMQPFLSCKGTLGYWVIHRHGKQWHTADCHMQETR